jgi:hypothetical protein
MAEEKRPKKKGRKNVAEKEGFQHLAESQWAECSNGRNCPNPDHVAKKGQY